MIKSSSIFVHMGLFGMLPDRRRRPSKTRPHLVFLGSRTDSTRLLDTSVKAWHEVFVTKASFECQKPISYANLKHMDPQYHPNPSPPLPNPELLAQVGCYSGAPWSLVRAKTRSFSTIPRGSYLRPSGRQGCFEVIKAQSL